MKRSIYLLVFVSITAIQYHYKLNIGSEFIGIATTCLAIFFGFYLTSLSVFSTSKYLSVLNEMYYQQSKTTFLEILLNKYKIASYILLCSLMYLLITYIGITEENFFKHLSHFILAIVALNFIVIIFSIKRFIVIILQSIKYQSER